MQDILEPMLKYGGNEKMEGGDERAEAGSGDGADPGVFCRNEHAVQVGVDGRHGFQDHHSLPLYLLRCRLHLPNRLLCRKVRRHTLTLICLWRVQILHEAAFSA